MNFSSSSEMTLASSASRTGYETPRTVFVPSFCNTPVFQSFRSAIFTDSTTRPLGLLSNTQPVDAALCQVRIMATTHEWYIDGMLAFKDPWHACGSISWESFVSHTLLQRPPLMTYKMIYRRVFKRVEDPKSFLFRFKEVAKSRSPDLAESSEIRFSASDSISSASQADDGAPWSWHYLLDFSVEERF